MTSEQYSVSSVEVAQKIALDLKENLDNILKDYKNNPVKQGNLLYAALIQAENAWCFILDNIMTSIPKETAHEYLNRILEGIKYLENIDERLVFGTIFLKDDTQEFTERLFYI